MELTSALRVGFTVCNTDIYVWPMNDLRVSARLQGSVTKRSETGVMGSVLIWGHNYFEDWLRSLISFVLFSWMKKSPILFVFCPCLKSGLKRTYPSPAAFFDQDRVKSNYIHYCSNLLAMKSLEWNSWQNDAFAVINKHTVLHTHCRHCGGLQWHTSQIAALTICSFGTFQSQWSGIIHMVLVTEHENDRSQHSGKAITHSFSF